MLKKLAAILLDPVTSKTLLALQFSGYLKDIGWFNAFKSHKPVDSQNQPIPWVSYPFLHFLEKRLKKDYDLFEFGCGYSTLYFAKRLNSVTAVEHDKNWFNEIKPALPSNATVIFKELSYGGEYSNTPLEIQSKFDIIVVDGRDRVNCIKNSLNALKENGVVILDNSDREEYKKGYDIMTSHNFKYIDFWGIAPGYLHTTCTTVFYKPLNCLNI